MAAHNPNWSDDEILNEVVFDYLASIPDDEIQIIVDQMNTGDLTEEDVRDLALNDKRFQTKAGREPKCFCYHEKETVCFTCGVKRPFLAAPWEWATSTELERIPYTGNSANAKAWLDDDAYWNEAEDYDAHVQWDKEWKDSHSVSGYGNGYDWYAEGYGGSGWEKYYSDRHYNHKFEVKGLTLYASSVQTTRKPDDLVPDHGVYFDRSWSSASWTKEMVLWHDFGLPEDYAEALKAITHGIELAQKGYKVEFGCIGGHGRTGTALAVACVILGMSPKDAITFVKTAYCERAIETDEQEWFVSWVEHTLRGTELPKKPESKWRGWTNKKSTPYLVDNEFSTKHTLAAHYDTWKKGDQCVSKAKGAIEQPCSFWIDDVIKFQKGEYPSIAAITTKVVYVADNTGVRQGWRIPKAGAIDHTPHKKSGCKCDICRYFEAGHGAFIEPLEYSKLQAFHRSMADLDAELKDIEECNDNFGGLPYVKMIGKDGKLFDVPIASNFTPKPPENDGPRNGYRQGEYVWLKGEGWIWERLSKVPDSMLTDYTPPAKVMSFKKATKRAKKELRKLRQKEKQLTSSGRRNRR